METFGERKPVAYGALSAGALGILGLVTGAVDDIFVRRARLRSSGVIDHALLGGDMRRLRIFGLALAVANTGTEALVVAGWLDLSKKSYVPAAIAYCPSYWEAQCPGYGWHWVALAVLDRLRFGGGCMRSLIVVTIFGAIAHVTCR